VGDVYVYCFFPFALVGATGSRSTSAATLAAIEKIGIPIMESQVVVDRSEVNGEGFLVATVGIGSPQITRLNSQIKSLELRAASRDRQALSMDVGGDGPAIYMLNLESRYLRQQTQRLAIERAELLAEESCHITRFTAFPAFAISATPE
jgi:hypothetical protein